MINDSIFSQLKSSNEVIEHPQFLGYEVLKKFTQHSFSQTLLLKKNDRKIIRKFTLANQRHKVLNQAHWFNGMPDTRVFPKVVNTYSDDKISFVDLEYFSDSTTFFEYIHNESEEKISKIFIEILDFIHNSVHSKSPTVFSYQDTHRYIQKKILAKVNECKNVLPQMAPFIESDKLIINGRIYTGLKKLLKQIASDSQAMDCISLTRPGVIHGDLTIENILISPKGFHIIDPNDENFLLTPMVDYAKLMQSLDSGYEFLQDSQVQYSFKSYPEINCSVILSREYIKLRQFLVEETERLFPSIEQHSLYFHQAAHFARLLPYKAYTNPDKILVYYAELIKKLNLFYDRIQAD